jgi:hypothetical protein
VKPSSFVLTAVVLLGAFGAALVAGGETPPSPLEKAKAGQWVLLETQAAPLDTAKPADARPDPAKLDAAKPTHVYQFVERVEGRRVHLVTQTVTADGKTGLDAAFAMVVNLDEMPADAPREEASTSEEEITVKGKSMKCIRTETVTDLGRGNTTTIRWVSRDVPIFGLVRSVVLDKNKKELSRYDLVDFGDTGGAARPLESERPPSDK